VPKPKGTQSAPTGFTGTDTQMKIAVATAATTNDKTPNFVGIYLSPGFQSTIEPTSTDENEAQLPQITAKAAQSSNVSGRSGNKNQIPNNTNKNDKLANKIAALVI
jgi:hypothetical protein